MAAQMKKHNVVLNSCLQANWPLLAEGGHL